MSRLDDGHQTTIEFSAGSTGVVLTTLMEEKTVTPPGVSAGGANPTTTMRNETWRTNAPKALKTLTQSSISVAYDPALYDEIVAQAGVNQSIVITFPDDSTLTFWGWIDEFTPSAAEEGEQPTAEITIIPSNQNASGAETAPLYAAA